MLQTLRKVLSFLISALIVIDQILHHYIAKQPPPTTGMPV